MAVVFSGIPAAVLKREALEEHVERLIALLDMLDGDVDLEPDNDDEPTLGSGCEDGELENDGTAEPDLGSVGSCSYPEHIPQTMWSAGSPSDRESDAGDEPEPDADEEYWRQFPRLDNLRGSDQTGARNMLANEDRP